MGQIEDAGGRLLDVPGGTLSHVEFQAQRLVPKHELGTPKCGQLAPPAPIAAGDGGGLELLRIRRGYLPSLASGLFEPGFFVASSHRT